MLPCKYQTQLKCPLCTFPYHNLCTKFVTANTLSLVKSLLPFKYSKQSPKSSISWSRNADTAKSIALSYCKKFNTSVKKLSLSQVLTIVISNEPIESQVFFIDYSTKAPGDPEKVKSCLLSFIESQSLHNACISIYVNKLIPNFSLDYPLYD